MNPIAANIVVTVKNTDTRKMPQVFMQDIQSCTSSYEYNIISKIVFTQKNITRIRSTRPDDGVAAYVWRRVVFVLSYNPVHHCFPAMCEDYLNKSDWKHRTENKSQYPNTVETHMRIVKNKNTARKLCFIVEELLPIVDKVVASVLEISENDARNIREKTEIHRRIYGI